MGLSRPIFPQTDALPTICHAPGCYNTASKRVPYCGAHLPVTRKAEDPLTRRQRQAQHGARAAKAYLYAVRAGQTVKFGAAKNVKRRLVSLQAESPEPLTLHGAIYCSKVLEAVVHEVLEHCRHHGEWYHLCAHSQRLADLIAAKDLSALERFLSALMRR